jgi:hypothetical protein
MPQDRRERTAKLATTSADAQTDHRPPDYTTRIEYTFDTLKYVQPWPAPLQRPSRHRNAVRRRASHKVFNL